MIFIISYLIILAHIILIHLFHIVFCPYVIIYYLHCLCLIFLLLLFQNLIHLVQTGHIETCDHFLLGLCLLELQCQFLRLFTWTFLAAELYYFLPDYLPRFLLRANRTVPFFPARFQFVILLLRVVTDRSYPRLFLFMNFVLNLPQIRASPRLILP